MENNTKTIYKSSVTGKIVSKKFADANPSTTFALVVPIGKKAEKESRKSGGFREVAERQYYENKNQ